MADNNLDKALAYLGSSLQSLVQQANGPVDLDHLHTRIAKRSLTGDHLNGGTIVNFASTGIKDEATSQQIIVRNTGLESKNLTVTEVITAKTIKVDFLDVKESNLSTKPTESAPLEITVANGETLVGKGMLLKGQGPTKQLIFSVNPDKFLSTENFELIKGKEYRIDGDTVLKANELGMSVTKSHLREVGRLRGLIVDGSLSVGQYIYFDDNTNRLGIGIESANAGLSVCEDGVEVMLGTKDSTKGMVGTFASVAFDIVTDNTSRINIGSSGHITLGNINEPAIQVSVHGKMSVGVKSIDSRADLHVAGAIKFSDRLHQYSKSAPDNGTFERGSIVWNTEPTPGGCIGWVCYRAGSPGAWAPFGEIKDNG